MPPKGLRKRPLRIVVIGVGRMGTIHAAKVRQLDERDGSATLVGVADSRVGRASAVAADLRTVGVANYHALLTDADAAIVAVPTSGHYAVARDVIRAGLDALVEKPLTATLSHAENLCDEAAQQERILQVGLLEYFNPVFTTLRAIVDSPQSIEVWRTSQFRPTTADIDVVHDLMIHDLHIVQQLLGNEPTVLAAVGHRVASRQLDAATAWLRFPSGCTARLCSSRVADSRMRLIRIRQGTTTIVANFLLQTVTAQELSGATTSIRARRPDQSLDDVAMNQLIGFIRAIQRRDAGTVAASEVLTTLRTANRVLNAALLSRAEARAPLTGALGRRFRAADKLGGSPSV